MGQVVSLEVVDDAVVQVTMHDRNSRNTFSKELVREITEAFEIIKNNKIYKVIVLTGYDNYFCCGGTKEELFAIYRKEIGFNDLNFFSLPLFAEIPVISAMQGHGIGGGLVFGAYADFMILGKECVYTANFMKFGFTPGMGGTFMLPLRFGQALGSEMLFTAENFRGAQLKERGATQRIVPRAEVLSEALHFARILAEKPRLSLVTLKSHLTQEIKEKLPLVIAQELQMHDTTFHQPEVEVKIEKLFGA